MDKGKHINSQTANFLALDNKMTVNTINTSLNQIPAVMKSHVVHNSAVLNYGCGRGHAKAQAFLEANNNEVINFDPNLPEFLEPQTIKSEVVYAANVLNVIKSTNELIETINDIANNTWYEAIISIYEGDKSSEGRATSKGYQRNEKAIEYTKLLEQVFQSVERKGNVFVCLT